MVKMKKRERGGASHPCPKCKDDSHVLVTRREVTRRHNDFVSRKRQCLSCGQPFTTIEIIPKKRRKKKRPAGRQEAFTSSAAAVG